MKCKTKKNNQSDKENINEGCYIDAAVDRSGSRRDKEFDAENQVNRNLFQFMFN